MSTDSPQQSNQPGESSLKKFTTEQQNPAIVQQVHQKVSQILTRDEEILYIACIAHHEVRGKGVEIN